MTFFLYCLADGEFLLRLEQYRKVRRSWLRREMAAGHVDRRVEALWLQWSARAEAA